MLRLLRTMPDGLNLAPRTQSFRLAGLTPAAFIVMAVVFLTALAVSARTWFTSPPLAGKPTTAVAQGKPASDPLIVEQIVLLPSGFQPAAFTRPKGRFLLAVDNRSGVEEMALVFSREAGNKLREVKVHRKRLDWNDEFDLSPGTYLLTESNHPQWSCRITVTSK